MASKHNVDLSLHWHKGGSRDKYEISLEDINIEIKTTAAIDEEVTIKHTQLFNADQNYLVVVCVEETAAGQTLNQLISSMLFDQTHFKNYNFVLNIEREKRRVSPVEANRKTFSVKVINLYDATIINPFDSIPGCVSQLTYKLDLVEKECVPDNQWSELFSVD